MSYLNRTFCTVVDPALCVFKKKILFCGPFGHLSSDADLLLLLSSVELLLTRVVVAGRVVIVEDVLTTSLLVLLNTETCRVVPFDM